MKQYQRILISIDLSSEPEQALKKAQHFAGEDVVSHLVYVQEPMENVYVGIVPQSAAFGGLGELV